MHAALLRVIELVTYLEPDRGASATDVVVHTATIDNKVHHHLVGLANQKDIHVIAARTNSSVQPVALEQLASFELCGNDHEGAVSVGDVIDAFTNRELGIAAFELDELKDTNPGDQDIEKILSRLSDIARLASLCREFNDFEDSVYDHLSQISYGDHPEEYSQRLTPEYSRIMEELEKVRTDTIASPTAVEILAEYASTTYKIVRDETPVLAVHKPSAITTLHTETEAVMISLYIGAVRSAFIGTSGNYQTLLGTMPLWAVELIKALDADSIASQLYRPDQLDPVVAETAQSLWNESRMHDGIENTSVLSDFDSAVRAAERLIVG